MVEQSGLDLTPERLLTDRGASPALALGPLGGLLRQSLVVGAVGGR